MIANREPWMADAACQGMNPEIFFPNPTDYDGIEKAKAICEGCPVALNCTELATRKREQEGVWGGQVAPIGRRRRREKQTVPTGD